MRKTAYTVLLCAALAACAGGSERVYTLEFSTEDPGRISLLSVAATRVVERRLQSMGEEVKNLDIRTGDAGVQIAVTVPSANIGDILTEDLTEPFALQIMKEVPEDGADIVIEGHGGFSSTGITQEHLEWAEATEEEGQKGRITLTFTQDGRNRMAQLFQENEGKNIGLFVRDRLVAKLQVDTGELKDDIVISGIPSVELAHVFADDVNVGLYLRFIPVE